MNKRTVLLPYHELLLATATQPDLANDPPWYPTPQMIAERRRGDTDTNATCATASRLESGSSY
jgi:hypothetical protein